LRIAKDIQVRDVRPTDSLYDYTDFSLGFPVIYLSNKQADHEKRFVLAHELAHVILRMPEVIDLLHKRHRDDFFVDEESSADSVAATILLPDNWIESLRTSYFSLRLLKQLARLADVSMGMLISRMATAEIDIGLLHWRRGRGGWWHVIDRPGVPSSLHGYIDLSSSSNNILEQLSGNESDMVVDCNINGRRAKLAGKGYRRGAHAFQFLVPSVDIWIDAQEFDAHMVVPNVRSLDPRARLLIYRELARAECLDIASPLVTSTTEPIDLGALDDAAQSTILRRAVWDTDT
jgi:hypothetical protein